MNYPFFIRSKVSIAASALLLLSVGCLAQTSSSGRNNPYSPSPSGRVKPVEEPVANVTAKSGPGDVTFVMQSPKEPFVDDSRIDRNHPTIAQQTFRIAKNADERSRPATETYKIGVGDVLFVNLKNSAQGSGYYTVRADGTIDYPLAGENVVVADQTTDTLEDNLASAIKLFADAQVEVKVRQFSSHKITVSGMVSNGGDKNLQREAMPLFAIRAEAGVDPKATKVTVTRSSSSKAESYDLHDAATDNILIYPGNTLEFTGSPAGFYYISGAVNASGQKDIVAGMTLYQAVVASGAKGDPKKAAIRRRNEQGLFSTLEFNLRSIKDGKMTDPPLVSGDVIEVKN